MAKLARVRYRLWIGSRYQGNVFGRATPLTERTQRRERRALSEACWRSARPREFTRNRVVYTLRLIPRIRRKPIA